MSSQDEKTIQALKVKKLKDFFAAHLREAHQLKTPEGLATGLAALDRFLLWGGLPKGALSLFCGALGSGRTSLWLEAAARVIANGRWVAWVNGAVPLAPLSLYHKGVQLDRFVSIEKPEEPKQIFWLLQELMASSLFELIGCELDGYRLREHQARKLQAQARAAHVALVFLSQQPVPRGSLASVFSLILNFEEKRLLVERALHRPTPHSFPRSIHYARFTLHTGDRIILGSDLAGRTQAEPSPHGAQPLPPPSSAADSRI